MDDGFTLWESLTEEPALRATAAEDEPVILSYSVHYDFPTVTVEPYFTTNNYDEPVFVRSFYLNGPAAVEVKGSKVKKNGEPANTNQILTGVKIPANVRAAFEEMKADPSASFDKTGSYAGQGVIGWGYVGKYDERNVKSHLIIQTSEGTDTACHHKVDRGSLTLTNDTPPAWERCQACQRILDAGAEVPSPFGQVTAGAVDDLLARTEQRKRDLEAHYDELRAPHKKIIDDLLTRERPEGQQATDAERAQFDAATQELIRLDREMRSEIEYGDIKPSPSEMTRARAIDRGKDPDKVCPRCGGTGQYRGFGTCYECGGTGEVDDQFTAAKKMGLKIRFVNAQRGGAGAVYVADLEVDGEIVGFVQQRRKGDSYYAQAFGLQVGRARTLTELREDLAEDILPEDMEEWRERNKLATKTAQSTAKVGSKYLGGTIKSVEGEFVVIAYAGGNTIKVAWDESQHPRAKSPDGTYLPGQFVPKDHSDAPGGSAAPGGSPSSEDTSIFDGGEPGTPAPSAPAEGDEAVMEGDQPQEAPGEAPGGQEEGVEAPEPEPEEQPDLSMFDTDESGVMKPPKRHAPVDMGAKKAFAALPTATRDALADPTNTIPARVNEIVAPRAAEYPDDIRELVDQRMDEIKGVMPPKIGQMARQHMQHLGNLLQAANPAADPAMVKDLMLDACDYLVAQDAEAQGRTLGDHGARHLLTDARVASEVVKLAGDGDPATEAMMYLCGIFHDTGYMAPPARQFLDSDHPRWSRHNYKANIAPKVEAVLGPEVAKEAAKIIVSHDRTEMNWDEGERAASAFRLADNLGLFHADKLPGFAYLVPQNVGVMVQLAEGRLDVEAARTELKANVNQSDLSGQVKSHLYDAIDEVGAMLPKFMLGMVGTKLGNIEWAGDHPVVHLQRTEANEALAKVLDMGQRQFLKFAETYMGEEEAPKFLEKEHFAFQNRRGNLVLESRLDNPMTKDDIKAIGVNIRVRGGWLFDKLTQPVYDYAKDRFGTEPSFDWCRFRHDSHCYFPKDLDVQATEQAGYDVWIPIDRGYCPRIKWKQQEQCPIGEPGPNTHHPDAGLETWQSYEDGGQRGYASLTAALETKDSEGEVGNRNHITRKQDGTVPTSAIANLMGVKGEVPGEHRNRQGQAWEDFKADIAARGIIDPIFITVDYGEDPKISEGNHRRDAAVELGLPEVPVEIRYFGHAEQTTKVATLDEMMASFEFTSSWADVNAKAKRIRQEGGVNIISVTEDTITAEVRGDNDTYLTSIQRVPGTKQIALWECSCPWSTYSWGRSGRWKKYEGRMCSHAQAVVYQAQSDEMFGGEIEENTQPTGEKWDFPTPMTQPGPWRVGHLSFYDLPPKIATRGFLVRWRDSIHLVTDILANMLRLDTGEEVPASEVTHPNYSPTLGLTASKTASMEVTYTEWGEVGNRTHITREDRGTLPIGLVKQMPGKNGERPGEHRNKHGQVWEDFKADIAANGLQHPIFITQDFGERPYLSEGNHRRDACVELGWDEIPATVRYFGRAEEGSALARYTDTGSPLTQAEIDSYKFGSKTALDSMNGCMVALIPPLSIRQALAIEGGEPVEHMHITLAYLGKAADVDLDAVHAAVAEWAGRTPELSSEFSGFGTFGNGEEPVLWATFDAPGLERYREELVDTLARHGVPPKNGHGFQLHMTLGYGEYDMPDFNDLDPFLFEAAIVAEGNKWTHYPLSGNPVEPVMAETIEVDAALFEGRYFTMDEVRAAAAESMLHEEPEPALPSTDGAEDSDEDGEVVRTAAAARGTRPVGEGGDPIQGHLAGPPPDSRAWLMKSSGHDARDKADIAAQAKAFLNKQAVRDFTPAEQARIISEGEGQTARNLDRLILEGTHYSEMSGEIEDDELLWL